MQRIGVVGASGYVGAELLRLGAQHPDLEIVLATGDSQAGQPIAALYPNLGPVFGDRCFAAYDLAELQMLDLDLAFLALPHGASQALMAEVRAAVPKVVDLAADFRLRDAALYPQWYGEPHQAPALLPDFAYGLPELYRAEIRATDAVAAPGCYPTAGTLALAPLVRAGLVDVRTLVVDAASGVSGAGRPPKPNTTFCTVDEDFTAYGLLDHRHTPELEQNLGFVSAAASPAPTVLFTPHLAPMNRGILATCYARSVSGGAPPPTAELLELYREAYADEPFVFVIDGSPSTKATLGTNAVHVTVRSDPRTGYIVAIAAIDNLVKGAAGAAVQCANLLLDLPETSGLPVLGLYP